MFFKGGLITDNEIIDGLNLATKILKENDYSIIIIKEGTIKIKKKGEGIRPFLEIIEESKNEIKNSIIGYRILGKASALLCKYANVKAVYSPMATKKAIAVLIRYSIPCQTDKVIEKIKNKLDDDICPFEKMLENINSPDRAYTILKDKLI
jgi:hypothetical protein